MIKKEATNSVFNIVKTIIANNFNIDKDKITLETSSDEIEEWDSLGHIHLILRLEAAFNVKFNILVIPKLTSVTAIVRELEQSYEQST